MSRLDPSARVRNHITEILADGPIRFEALSAALADRGLALGPDPDERVSAVMDYMDEIAGASVENPDNPDELIEMIYDRRGLIDGTTWTVAINDIDTNSDTLSANAVGLMFMVLLNGWAELEGAGSVEFDMEGRRRGVGEELGIESDGGAGILLPPGWLSTLGARPGSYVQLRLDGDVIRATPTESAPEPTEAMIRYLVDVIASEPDESHPQAQVLTQLLLIHDDLRSMPLPPLKEWFDRAGLVRRGPMVAAPGFDFNAQRLQDDIEEGIDHHRLKGREAVDFAKLLTTAREWLGHKAEDPQDPRAIQPNEDALTSAAAALGSVPAAVAFVDEAFDRDRVDELVEFGGRLVDLTSGPDRAGPAWMIAQMMGLAGRTERYEAWIDTALGFDDDHFLSLYDRSWFEFDRGELRKAKALMNRLGMPPHSHDMALIDSVLGSDGPSVGRNDPCPCGSGRKYKRCHLGIDEIPLSARLTLLYRKANRWLEYRHRNEVLSAAMVRSSNSDIAPGKLLETDPLIADAVLAEGGRMAEWLTERGALLPSDEAMLASQWALIERSVYEVIEVRPDQGLTLRDVRSGDTVDVSERLGTRGMKVGSYILVRPLPVGDDRLQFFGGITFVPDSMVNEFIDLLDSGPTAFQLLALLATTEAPRQVQNRDGEQVVFSEMTWRVDDASDARRVLDEVFEPDGGGGEPAEGTPGDSATAFRWMWLADSDDLAQVASPDRPDISTGSMKSPEGRTVLANITLVGDRLSVSTNSAGRAERAAALIAEQFQNAVLLEHLQSSIEDIREDRAYEEYIFGDPSSDDSASDSAEMDLSSIPPEVRAALREQMDVHEERWVDESIPALGGVTPRQALDDPTRRDDLYRLLDRMEEMESKQPLDQAGFGMRTSRLRELLGI